jgi:predicted phage terminase large subunit-like protein
MLPKLAPEEFNAVLRTDFGFFCEMCFRELHNGQHWIDAPYLRLLEHLFARCHHRELRRLIINMPPRHMKSMFASVFYPAWRLAHCPSTKIICASYSEDLGSIFSRQVRQILRAPWYLEAFQNTRLSSEKSSVGHIETTAGGRVFSTTPGGTVAGVGADDIILDDIMKPQNANSAEARQTLLNWAPEIFSRFDKPAEGVRILVMHRLHPDDISEHLEQSGEYLTIKLPLVAEDDQTFHSKGMKQIIFARKSGEALNPVLTPPEEIKLLKKDIPHNVFLARYQQQPVAAGAGLVKAEWFPRYDEIPAGAPVLQSWDIATTANAGDYSVCITFAWADGNFYVQDVFRKQIAYPDLRHAVRQLDEKYKPMRIVIETVAAGIALYQDLCSEGMKHLLRCDVKIDKLTRLEACTPFFTDGHVLLPKQAPWLSAFLNELIEFPVGAYDDQVDSLSQIIGYRATVLDAAKIKSKYHCSVTH